MVAFLVDGELEQRFLQEICPGKRVLKIGCNGKTVSAEAIAIRIDSLKRTIRGSGPVIACVDLESRKLSPIAFEKEVTDELTKLGTDQSNLFFTVVDRMIENWILADPEANALPWAGVSSDGFGGKGRLKKLVSNYHETTVGVTLLKSVRPSCAVQRSASFARFFARVQNQVNDCWWMAR